MPVEYRVLTESLCFPQWKEKLKFEIDPSILVPPYGYIVDDYASVENYGQLPRDADMAMQHAAKMLNSVQISIDCGKTADCCSKMIDDLHNLLYCYNQGTPVNRKMTMALIASMLAVDGCARSVAGCIQSYYDGYSRNIFHKDIDNDPTEHYALDFEMLYTQYGDYALFLDQDVDLAMQFYHLAALNWHDPKAPNYTSTTGDWIIEHIMVLILSGGMKLITPDQPLLSALLSILGNIVETLDNGDNTQIVKLADECFSTYDKAIVDINNDIEQLRMLVMIAWAVKKFALLPALCCLHKESGKTVERFARSAKASIAAMRLPDAPTRPLLGYLNANGEHNASIWDLLRFASTIDITHRVQNALRVRQVKQDMAYYTSLDTLMYMMPARCKDERDLGKLSVMNLAYMNDPNEGRMLHKYLKADRDLDGQGARKNATYPFVFMKCFTSRIDDLPMWEMYGDHAQGVCIVVDWMKALTSSTSLYRVCYMTKCGNAYELDPAFNQDITELDAIKKWLDELQDLRASFIGREPKQFFDSLLEGIAYLFKDSSYHYEQELRILYAYSEAKPLFRHTAGDYPKLYIQTESPVTIKEIIIGPKFKELAMRMPYLREQIETMCRLKGTTCPKLTISDIEYR